jgi:hypothetical protein
LRLVSSLISNLVLWSASRAASFIVTTSKYELWTSIVDGHIILNKFSKPHSWTNKFHTKKTQVEFQKNIYLGIGKLGEWIFILIGCVLDNTKCNASKNNSIVLQILWFEPLESNPNILMIQK